MNKYVMLAISIVAEVFAASMLKMTDGLTNFTPLIGVILGYIVSFSFLGLLLKQMPLSVAYAIWAGLGTVLTAIVSVLFFGEIFTMLKVLGIFIIVSGIIILNLNLNDEKIMD